MTEWQRDRFGDSRQFLTSRPRIWPEESAAGKQITAAALDARCRWADHRERGEGAGDGGRLSTAV